MKAAEAWVLLALFVILGGGVDRVVQFGKALGGRGDPLIGSAGRQVSGLRLAQVASVDGLLQGAHGFDQRRTLHAQIHTVFGQCADERGHRGRLGAGLGLSGRGHVQSAVRVGQQAAGDAVVARLQVGVNYHAQARCDVLALFEHHHAVEDFPFNRAFRAVDDTKRSLASRHRQRIGFTVVGVDGDRGFRAVVDQALVRGQLRGVVEQAAGRDHQDHGTDHDRSQGTRRLGFLWKPGRGIGHRWPYLFTAEEEC